MCTRGSTRVYCIYWRLGRGSTFSLKPRKVYCFYINTENGWYESYSTLWCLAHVSKSVHRGTAAPAVPSGLILPVLSWILVRRIAFSHSWLILPCTMFPKAQSPMGEHMVGAPFHPFNLYDYTRRCAKWNYFFLPWMSWRFHIKWINEDIKSNPWRYSSEKLSMPEAVLSYVNGGGLVDSKALFHQP